MFQEFQHSISREPRKIVSQNPDVCNHAGIAGHKASTLFAPSCAMLKQGKISDDGS
jgi:hypothetical protein